MGDIYLPLTRLLLLANQMSVNLTKQNAQLEPQDAYYIAERRHYAVYDYEDPYEGNRKVRMLTIWSIF